MPTKAILNKFYLFVIYDIFKQLKYAFFLNNIKIVHNYNRILQFIGSLQQKY